MKAVDESSIASVAGTKVVRIESFLAVVAEREWNAVRAARQLRAEWTGGTPLGDHATLFDSMRASTIVREQPITRRGDVSALDSPGPGVRTLSSTYRWPVHSHGSIGPSCGVADVSGDRATIWSSSQGTHRYRAAFARVLGLAPERVRVIYLDGAGSYGQNGAEDAACDAALLSKALGRPVRVQWSRQDEHGWDPKGPPQLLDLAGTVNPDGKIVEWRVDMWVPEATRGLPNVPLLATYIRPRP